MADNVVIKVGEQQWVRGEDGFDPVVTIEDIEHGHRVTITDREHPIEGQSFDVMDGASAYEQAVAGGYEGTEEEFNADLADFSEKEQAATNAAAAAAQSAQNAADSAATATTKAQEAAESAATALTRMNSANSSAQAAANAATSAGNSANAAASSASAANGSASSASTSAQSAAASATAAAGSASTASTAATTAQGHASNAASSSTAASGSAAAAATSESNAAASATAAGNAQTAAEAAQAAAAEVAPFYAEYGVTTAEEIEAAINGKRQIYLRSASFTEKVAPYTGTFTYADIWGEGTGYRFAITDGDLQYVYELKSEWTYSIYDLTAPAQRAETAAAAAEEAAQSVDADRINERLGDLEQATTATTVGPASIATFDASAADMPLKGLTVDIEPVQDLHGYDHPWPGGGGKNLLPITASTSTVSGVTFTVKTDSGGNVVSIVANGTASANISNKDITFGNITLPAGQYFANGLASGSQSTYRLAVYDSAAATVNVNIYGGADRLFELTETTTLLVYPVILNGQTVSNVEYRPMIRLATETDNTFEPYSNICPISGWTGCNILQYPENLLSIGDIRTGRITSDGGFNVDTTTRCATLVFIPVAQNTKYTIATNVGVQCIAVHYYSAENVESWLYRDAISGQITAFTTPANCSYIRVMFAKDNTSASITPSDITTAILMRGNTYNVTFPSPDPGTVYGGTLDVVNGKLTVTWALIMASNIEWAQGTSSTEYRQVFNDARTGGKGKKPGDSNILCSKYGPHTSGSAFSIRAAATSQLVTIRDANFVSDLAGFQASLTGVQIAYELENPITYHLTPQEITTLLGENNIWADCGDVTVTYGAYLETVKAHADQLGDSILSAIAPLEASYTASRTYAVGSYLFVGTKFYKVTAAIGSGDTINPGTNVTQTTVAAQLMELAGN